MSFGSSTVTIDVNSVNKVLVKINQTNFGSTYYLREADQDWTLNVRHSQEGLLADGSRFDRHNVELINTVFATDTDPAQVRVAYAVFRNKRNDDYTDVGYVDVALSSLLDATSIDDLLAWKN